RRDDNEPPTVYPPPAATPGPAPPAAPNPEPPKQAEREAPTAAVKPGKDCKVERAGISITFSCADCGRLRPYDAGNAFDGVSACRSSVSQRRAMSSVKIRPTSE